MLRGWGKNSLESENLRHISYLPKTTSTDLVRVSHWAIVVYALVLAAFCCVLNPVVFSLT
jgi:hypothetical protein